jgi:hypothetical protein
MVSAATLGYSALMISAPTLTHDLKRREDGSSASGHAHRGGCDQIPFFGTEANEDGGGRNSPLDKKEQILAVVRLSCVRH